MYDITTLKILGQIYINPGIHKREISRKLRLTMPSVDNSIRKIDKIVKKQKSGNQIKFYIDYSKEALTPAISEVEYLRLEKLPSKINIAVKSFLQELKEKPLIALIFGSYARGDYTRDSDIDLLLVFQKSANSNEIENIAKKISMNTNTKISPVYLDYNSFKKSFHDPTKEFFKNIKKERIVLLGMEWWRQLQHEEN